MLFILHFVLRVVNAIGEANHRKAEREVAKLIRQNGGRLTDTLERHIERSMR